MTLLSVRSSIGADAQQTLDPLPERSRVDVRGVDLVSGKVLLSGAADISIGDPTAGGRTDVRAFNDRGWRGNALGTASSSGDQFFVSQGVGTIFNELMCGGAPC